MSIPKKIHWCWLSGDPLPLVVQECIKSWKRHLPDYELILWDMNRFDIHSVPFVEQACAARKWAFAADYIRWYALYTEGGIYLDSDVKVYRKFDKFLKHAAFAGSLYYSMPTQNGSTSKQYWIEAECLGAEKGHPWMKYCLDAYQDKPFRTINSVVDMGIAPVVLTNACVEFGWRNEKVEKPLLLDNDIVIYPETYFAYPSRPLSIFNTYAVHICTNTWNQELSNFKMKEDFLLPLRKWHSRLIKRHWLLKRWHFKRKHLQKRIFSIFK